jgi:hypothetical protein
MEGRKDGKRRGCINYYLFNYLVNKGKKFENQVLIIKKEYRMRTDPSKLRELINIR